MLPVFEVRVFFGVNFCRCTSKFNSLPDSKLLASMTPFSGTSEALQVFLHISAHCGCQNLSSEPALPSNLPSVFVISIRGLPNSAAARSRTASFARSELSCDNLSRKETTDMAGCSNAVVGHEWFATMTAVAAVLSALKLDWRISYQ